MGITNIDYGNVVYREGEFEQEVVNFASAITYPAGTILARETTSQKFIPYVKGGSTNGNGVPRAIVARPVTSNGAGDLAVRVMLTGVVNKARLVIFGDGDGSNVDGAVRDLLRACGIVPVTVSQLGS